MKGLFGDDYNVSAQTPCVTGEIVDMMSEVSGFDLNEYGQYNIIIASIQMDANEKPFENIKNLLPWGTKIEVCPAVCTMCDNDAYFTKALFDIENASQEEKIGGKEMYEPRCAKHFSGFLI